MLKSEEIFRADEILLLFAEVCRKSLTPDGDWQGDGWGISYVSPIGKWEMKKSTEPIWEETEKLKSLPESKFFLVHARSSSFQNQRRNIEYNQPFVNGKFSFVFNGLVKGISPPFPVEGDIGSQKIWNVLLDLLKERSPIESLVHLKNMIIENSRAVQALNIGLCDGENIYALCYYTCHPEYYSLWYSKSSSLLLVSSNPILGYNLKKLSKGKILIL